jgi:hypothetical protein
MHRTTSSALGLESGQLNAAQAAVAADSCVVEAAVVDAVVVDVVVVDVAVDVAVAAAAKSAAEAAAKVPSPRQVQQKVYSERQIRVSQQQDKTAAVPRTLGLCMNACTSLTSTIEGGGGANATIGGNIAM